MAINQDGFGLLPLKMLQSYSRLRWRVCTQGGNHITIHLERLIELLMCSFPLENVTGGSKKQHLFHCIKQNSTAGVRSIVLTILMCFKCFFQCSVVRWVDMSHQKSVWHTWCHTGHCFCIRKMKTCQQQANNIIKIYFILNFSFELKSQ